MVACIAGNQSTLFENSAGWWNELGALPLKLGQDVLEDVGQGNHNARCGPLVLGLSTMNYRYVDMMTIQSIDE